MLAIFLSTHDEKPDLDMCIKLIVKEKKSLNVTTKPMKFSTLHKKLEGKVEWLKPLLSNVRVLMWSMGMIRVTHDQYTALGQRGLQCPANKQKSNTKQNAAGTITQAPAPSVTSPSLHTVPMTLWPGVPLVRRRDTLQVIASTKHNNGKF